MKNVALLYKLTGRILPEAEKLSGSISAMLDMDSEKTAGSLDLRCFSLFALYPGMDEKNVLSFVTALQGLAAYLDELCYRNGIRDEVSIRKLYPPLMDAIDPERTTYSYQTGYSMNAGRQVRKLVDQCRLCITALPSYKLVTGKMKKYIQLYIDFQALRYLPAIARQEYMETWADCYLKRYRGISCWEFSAAAGSLISVCSLFAAAGDPELTPWEVKTLDEAFFPWICSLHKLLEAYITARETTFTGQVNLICSYENLRTCEERLSFFADKAFELCRGLKKPDFHTFMLNCIISLYLSDSRAFFGMYRLASKNIIKNSPDPTGLYWKALRLLRRISVL